MLEILVETVKVDEGVEVQIYTNYCGYWVHVVGEDERRTGLHETLRDARDRAEFLSLWERQMERFKK